MASIGKAARLSGVPIETIRYYERVGVVPGPPRSASGRRVYDGSHIGRLRLIRHCRDLGFALADARALLGLAENNAAPCAEVKAIADGHLGQVRRRIRDLRDLERALVELVRNCEAGNTECPALQALAAP